MSLAFDEQIRLDISRIAILPTLTHARPRVGSECSFGPRWPEVRTVVATLKRYGIYYYDAKPANINFGEPPIPPKPQ